MANFEGQKVVVSGAATGLGQVIALEFAKEGANIVIVDFQEPKETMQKIAEVGGTAEFIRCDLRREEEIITAGQAVGKAFNGKVDILINNAGFNGKAQLVQDMELEDWNFTLALNLTGTMLMTREIIPYLLKQQAGKIINVASNVARRGLPYRADYVASKWALLGLTQTLALELADAKIRVNAVCPGPIEVDRINQVMEMHAVAEGKSLEQVREEWENVPMKRFIQPQEVTEVIKFLCSNASSAMTGQAINVTGGMIMT